MTNSTELLAVKLPEFIDMPRSLFLEKMQTEFERYKRQYHTHDGETDGFLERMLLHTEYCCRVGEKGWSCTSRRDPNLMRRTQ